MTTNKQIKEKFAVIDEESGVITLHSKQPDTNWNTFCIKDVTINFLDNGTIEISGEKIMWGFAFNDEFVDDIGKNIDKRYLYFKYKTARDFLNSIKRPYVKRGWYQLESTKQYHSFASKWFVVL